MKDIPGYEGLYAVTRDGKVWSHPKKYVLKRFGEMLKEGQFISGAKSRGYRRVLLYKRNKRKTHQVHRLVALTYIPNPENKPSVNHLNSIKDDNRVENLEWCTTVENLLWTIKQGRRKPGTGKSTYYNNRKRGLLIELEASRSTNKAQQVSQMLDMGPTFETPRLPTSFLSKDRNDSSVSRLSRLS